jgi:hypothetical protein
MGRPTIFNEVFFPGMEFLGENGGKIQIFKVLKIKIESMNLLSFEKYKDLGLIPQSRKTFFQATTVRKSYTMYSITACVNNTLALRDSNP